MTIPLAEIIGIDLAKDRCAKSNEERVIKKKRLSGGFQFTANEGHICRQRTVAKICAKFMQKEM